MHNMDEILVKDNEIVGDCTHDAFRRARKFFDFTFNFCFVNFLCLFFVAFKIDLTLKKVILSEENSHCLILKSICIFII